MGSRTERLRARVITGVLGFANNVGGRQTHQPTEQAACRGKVTGTLFKDMFESDIHVEISSRKLEVKF